jgi:hypothetical protein
MNGCSTIYVPYARWCLNRRATNDQGTLPLRLRGKLILLFYCCCNTLFLLLPVETLSNIVLHLVTSKSFNFAHIPMLLTSSLLLFHPTLGILLDILLALFQKRNITLIIPTTLLTSGSRDNSNLLLYKVIPEPLPIGHMLSSHDASYKSLSKFGEAI